MDINHRGAQIHPLWRYRVAAIKGVTGIVYVVLRCPRSLVSQAGMLSRPWVDLGWVVVFQKGSYAQLKHPTRGGRVTVPLHAGEATGSGLAVIYPVPGGHKHRRLPRSCERIKLCVATPSWSSLTKAVTWWCPSRPCRGASPAASRSRSASNARLRPFRSIWPVCWPTASLSPRKSRSLGPDCDHRCLTPADVGSQAPQLSRPAERERSGSSAIAL